MNWQLQLGIDMDLLKKAAPEIRERQIRILSILSLMLIAIGLLCSFSATVYTFIVFHNWMVALGVGFFMGAVAFNIYRLIIMTAMDASGTVLSDYMSDHDKHINEHIKPEVDVRDLTDVDILTIAAEAKNSLRNKPIQLNLRSGLSNSVVLTMTIRVIIISLMALVFAPGVQIFVFRDQINTVLSSIKDIYTASGDSWMIDNILTPAENGDFFFVNSNSLLVVLEILDLGLGNWKIIIDLFFLILFLLPLALIFKSKELYRGEYIKELVLSSVTISFCHHLFAKRACQFLKDSVASSVTQERIMTNSREVS